MSASASAGSEGKRGLGDSFGAFAGPLVLVGAGKMGSAMLEGWLALGLDPTKIVVFEPQPSAQLAAQTALGVRLNPSLADLRAAALVIAIKPQIAAETIPGLGALVNTATTVVSIMAGRTLAFLEKGLPAGTAIVRAMPNTPAAVGRGITVAVANQRAIGSQQDLADRLLATMGRVEWVTEEGLLDAVTAVSGSGPAYVFLLAESLARAGTAAGLPSDLAERLARATVAGAGELLHRSPLDAASLRVNVTSPGGTTAAALEVLMDQNGLDALMEKAVAAATRRSRDLAN
jgi:pyrroline-5-carboxylate reductase